MSKLLNKSTQYLLTFALITIVITGPIVYKITRYLYIEESDETLKIHKLEFLEYHKNFKISDIPNWNKYNRNVKILDQVPPKSDSIFTKFYFDEVEGENEPYRELNTSIIIEGKTFTYQEKNNLIEQEDMAFGVALLFLIVVIFLLIGILWINKISSQRLLKPFYKTLDEIESFELDKSQIPELPTTRIEEFNRLHSSLKLLISKNQKIYKSQREFVENAAHELQTPLAQFQSKIDSLFQTEGLSEIQMKFLTEMNSDIANLKRLNKNLLLLSKIENDNFPEIQDINISRIIQKNIGFFQEQAEAKNLIFNSDISENIIVKGNQSLFEILLNNLLMNAVKHGSKMGEIQVKLMPKFLEISNSGDNNPIDQNKIFNRFSKINSSQNGNGLGLAIIKKIAETNHWNIDYSYENDRHLFRLTW